MSALAQLETALDDIFSKKAPKLPENGKKLLVQYLPWINVVLGVLALWAAWNLYHVAHAVNSFLNNINQIYGGVVATSHLTAGVWLGVVILAIEGLLYLAAFPGTRDHKKSGWNFLFYAMLVNIVYGVVIVFTSYGNFGTLLSYVLSSLIGLYLLFQIRSSYKGADSTQTKKA